MDVVPQDKIPCMGRFPRKVVACMDHCPLGDAYCRHFWQFFQARHITPVTFFNVYGIGEDVMRRIVFDCDRCGKRDIKSIYSLNVEVTEAGVEPGPLGDDERREAVRSRGYSNPAIVEAAYLMLGLVQREKGWDHFCTPCFQRVCDGVATALGEKRAKRKTAARPPSASASAVATEAVVKPKRSGGARRKRAAAAAAPN